MKTPLTPAEVQKLTLAFPELDWMQAQDWQTVATYSDWRGWLDEYAIENDVVNPLECLLELPESRRQVRLDCREYFGEANVPNINDPDEDTWA